MNSREVQALLFACQLHDIDCMVRPPTVERTRLYRYLEDGAAGLMIPFASNAEIARHVVEAIKFPPQGNRGMDGAGLDGDYGLAAWAKDSTYTRDANNETFIVAQIETPEGVLKVDEVAAVPGIDCVFVGPGDLGLRLAAHPDSGVKSLDSAIELAAAAAKRHGKAWGAAAGSIDTHRRYRQMGAQVIPWGGDFALCQVLATCSAQLDSIG